LTIVVSRIDMIDPMITTALIRQTWAGTRSVVADIGLEIPSLRVLEVPKG
jgi:hypothetical protein